MPQPDMYGRTLRIHSGFNDSINISAAKLVIFYEKFAVFEILV